MLISKEYAGNTSNEYKLYQSGLHFAKDPTEQ